ncbi:hypothetical protein FQN53_007094 [Emmonsiellopsis sp. PD_33]|nr:hypothetical protein FQN53_007094 [Emmonsiellopsis sp. PD_33]
MPDVPWNARIIAICGATDEDDRAAPDEDGWLFSDFFLFHTLLYRRAARQSWITSEDPNVLVARYGEYVHVGRDSDSSRRVVLSEYHLESELRDITVIPWKDMLNTIEIHIASECKQAKVKDQPVLLCIFGYSDEATRTVRVGSKQLDVSALARYTAEVVQVDATIVTNACFAGGWVITRAPKSKAGQSLLRAKELAAANSIELLARSCGSIFLSAHLEEFFQGADSEVFTLVDELESLGVGSSSSSSLSGSSVGSRADAYYALSRVCHDHLLARFDRFGDAHGMCFGTDDDEWEKYCCRRSGIPLKNYAERWDRQEEDDTLCLSPRKENLRDLNSPSDSSSNPSSPLSNDSFAERIASYVTSTTELARTYLKSIPGNDLWPVNTALHKTCRDLISSQDDLTFKQLGNLRRALEYRLSLMIWADRLVYESSLSLPDGKTCREWDESHALEYDIDQFAPHLAQAGLLFAEPVPDHDSQDWVKPQRYVAATFFKSGLTTAELASMVQWLVKFTESVKRRQRQLLMSYPEVRDARRALNLSRSGSPMEVTICAF